MQLPVTLSLRHSRRLAAALALAHLMAGTGLAVAGLPLAVRLLLWLALGLSLFLALRPPWAIRLTLKSDGTLAVSERCGREAEWRVHPATTVFPWLIVLLLRDGKRMRALTLPLGVLDDSCHRQLRLWLKWKASAETA